MLHPQTDEIMNGLRDKSKQLLEIAKTIVEKAIETDEETAINRGDEQLKILGVNL